MPKTRLELARPCGHYTLNVACLPIPPLGQLGVSVSVVPRTRIELARPNGHMALNHARLPFPPPGRDECDFEEQK